MKEQSRSVAETSYEHDEAEFRKGLCRIAQMQLLNCAGKWRLNAPRPPQRVIAGSRAGERWGRGAVLLQQQNKKLFNVAPSKGN